jgi:hypothetical protein
MEAKWRRIEQLVDLSFMVKEGVVLGIMANIQVLFCCPLQVGFFCFTILGSIFLPPYHGFN